MYPGCFTLPTLREKHWKQWVTRRPKNRRLLRQQLLRVREHLHQIRVRGPGKSNDGSGRSSLRLALGGKKGKE